MNNNDKELLDDIISKAKEGDKSAFDLLYREYSEPLFKFMISRGSKPIDAEDIVSDSFVSAIQHIDQLKENKYFWSWLCSIAINKQKKLNKQREDHQRLSIIKDRSEYQNEEVDIMMSDALQYIGTVITVPADYVENDDVKNTVAQEVNKLSPDQQQATYMFYYEGKTTKEISKTLGISENTVKSRLLLAKKHLERSLKKLQKNGVTLCAVPMSSMLKLLEDEGLTNLGADTAAASAAGVSSASGAVVSRSSAPIIQAASKAAPAVATGKIAVGIAAILTIGILGGAVHFLYKYRDNDNISPDDISLGEFEGDNSSFSDSSLISDNSLRSDTESRVSDDSSVSDNDSSDNSSEDSSNPDSDIRFTYSNDPTPLSNAITISPKEIYKDGNDLVLDAYITNGYDYMVAPTNTTLNVFDASGNIFAQNEFRFTQNEEGFYLVIPPNDTAEWKFVFDNTSYNDTDADLTDVRCEGFTNYNINENTNGECGVNGNNVTWNIDDNRVLHISGTGEIKGSDTPPPFSNNTFVSSLIIDEGVTNIVSRMIEGCNNLTSISIPKSVSSIALDSFGGDENLTSFTVDEANPNYCSVDGVLYNKAMTKLIACPSRKTSVDIPESVTEIAENAFQGCKHLESVNLPRNLTRIGSGAFLNCENLKDITIPEKTTDIEALVFSGCSSLKKLTIHKNILSFTSNSISDSGVNEIEVESGSEGFVSIDGVLYDKDVKTLISCPPQKESISIPDSVETIWKAAFSGSCISKVFLPNSITVIDEYAFEKCENLSLVVLPNGLSAIGPYAFCDTYNLSKIRIPDSVDYIDETAFAYSNAIILCSKGSYAEQYCIDNSKVYLHQ